MRVKAVNFPSAAPFECFVRMHSTRALSRGQQNRLLCGLESAWAILFCDRDADLSMRVELIDHVVEETDACGDWMGALCEVEAKL
jgi:hypothetical protein